MLNKNSNKRRKENEMKRKAITITLPVEMLEVIRNYATWNKRTISSQIEMIIEEKLKEMEQHEESE